MERFVQAGERRAERVNMIGGVDAPAAAATRPLSVQGLACVRGERVLFAGLDFDVAAGDVVWLRAPNGFGKTTLLRVLAGLSRPAEGAVTWAGPAKPLYLAHANALKDDLTVAESLRYQVRLHGLDVPAGAEADAIRRLGLADRRRAPIRTLSQGQRRRVALLRLALPPPASTWLLDEPYDALDTEATTTVDALIGEHAARGGSVVLTSHVEPAIPGLRALRLDGR